MQEFTVLVDVDQILSQQKEMEEVEFLDKLITVADRIERNNPEVIKIFKVHIYKLVNDSNYLLSYEDYKYKEKYGKNYNYRSLYPNVANYLQEHCGEEIFSLLSTIIANKSNNLYDRFAIAAMYYYACGSISDVIMTLFNDISNMNIRVERDAFNLYNNTYEFRQSKYSVENILLNVEIPLLILADWLKNQILDYYASRALQQKFVSENAELVIQVCDQAICSLEDINEQHKNKNRGTVYSLASVEYLLDALKVWKPNVLQKQRLVKALEQLVMIMKNDNSWWLEEEALKYLNSWKKLSKDEVNRLPVWNKFVWYLQKEKITWSDLLKLLEDCEIYRGNNVESITKIFLNQKSDLLEVPNDENCEYILQELLHCGSNLIVLPMLDDEDISGRIEKFVINMLSLFIDVQSIQCSSKFHLLNELTTYYDEKYYFEYQSKHYAYVVNSDDIYSAYLNVLNIINNFLKIIHFEYAFYTLDNHHDKDILLIFHAKKKEFQSLYKKLSFPIFQID